MRTPLSRVRPAILAALGFVALVPQTARAFTILPGFDAFDTLPGTFFDIFTPSLPPIHVDLMGDPSYLGADTVVRRLAPIDLPGVGSSDTIPIELVALHLQSVNPVQLAPSSFFDVFVTLDVTPSTGSMTLNRTSADGGTFTSFFDVFFEITLEPVGSNTPFDIMHGHLQMQGGGQWRVDSFFDIFYEIPLDFNTPTLGTGQSTVLGPFQIGGTHRIQNVPEPFTMGLGGLAAVVGVWRIARKKRGA